LDIRPGERLGISANFASFPETAHTIFQLMFGEDVPALWADCSVQFPSCSKPVLDIDGKVLILSDCPLASINADWFFPAVLILTNYVMLNLFVGMIMNNFAYISAKDGNGAVEDDCLMDGAYKYVLHFDPKIKGQIPLEQVYQLYNLLGAPLDNYGTSQSLARFLCIREELTSRVKTTKDAPIFRGSTRMSSCPS